jgi:hypothetical protein
MYDIGSVVEPNPRNGYYYVSTTKGMTSSSPTSKDKLFPTEIGAIGARDSECTKDSECTIGKCTKDGECTQGGECTKDDEFVTWKNVGTIRGFPSWAASHPYRLNDVVQSTPPDGFYYKCVREGQSGPEASEFNEKAKQIEVKKEFDDNTVRWRKKGRRDDDYGDEATNPLLRAWYWGPSRFIYNRLAQPGVSQGSISIAPVAPATKATFDVQLYLSTLLGPGWFGVQGMYEYDRNQADNFNSLTAALTYDLRPIQREDDPRWWLSFAEPWANLNIPVANEKNVSAEGQYTGERSYSRITFILPFSAYLNARATWQRGTLPPLYQYVGNLITFGLTFSNPGVSEH